MTTDDDTPKKRKRSGSKVTRRRTRRTKSKAALKVLAERWPTAFRLVGERLPLKIGIDKDLFTALDGTLARWRIRDALGFYTYGGNYLRSLKEGALRIGLQGNQAGVVTAEQAAIAVEEMKRAEEQTELRRRARMDAARKERNQAKRTAPAAHGEATPAP